MWARIAFRNHSDAAKWENLTNTPFRPFRLTRPNVFLRRQAVLFLTLGVLLMPLSAHASSGTLVGNVKFTSTILLPQGSNEPGVTIGADGTVVVDALAYFDGGPGTRIWKGSFGSGPSYQGPADASLGKAFGGADASADLGSTGTLHLTTLVFFLNPALSPTVLPNPIVTQTGISAITCPTLIHPKTSLTAPPS